MVTALTVADINAIALVALPSTFERKHGRHGIYPEDEQTVRCNPLNAITIAHTNRFHQLYCTLLHRYR